MKKTVIFVVLNVSLVILSFFLGWEGSMRFYNVDNLFEVYQDLRKDSCKKEDIIRGSMMTMMFADSLIYENGLYDTDGSDLMQNYLESKNLLDDYLDRYFGRK